MISSGKVCFSRKMKDSEVSMFPHKKHTETSSTYKYRISPTESLGFPQGTKMKDLF